MSYLGDIWGRQPYSDHRLSRIQNKGARQQKLSQTYDEKYQKTSSWLFHLLTYAII